MSSRRRVALQAGFGAVVGVVLVALLVSRGEASGDPSAASCVQTGSSETSSAVIVSVDCAIPKPPPVTVTASPSASPTPTESPTLSPTPDPTPTSSAPVTTPTPTVTPTPTPTATATPTLPAGTCAATKANVPDGSDGAGGCFPGTANTGPNAPASSMPTYTGSCTITAANVVIDSKVVNCRTLMIANNATGFVLRNSYLNGGIVQPDGATAKWTVQDSLIDSSVPYPACSDGSCPAGKYACGDTKNQTTDCGINGTNFTVLRTEIVGSNRAAYCWAPGPCLIQDSYFHGTNLWPDKSNLAHASSVREEQGLTLRHNSLSCSYPGPFVNNDIGCSADLTGYPDFTAIKNNTIDGNLFIANAGNAFCAYGGATAGKPYSSDPTNATNQRFTNNVFQRGSNRKCGDYGPINDFDPSRPGAVWTNNRWDDGTSLAGN